MEHSKEPTTVVDRVAVRLNDSRLLEGVRRLGIAVSGGADSVAMLHLLLPHCRNHGIEPLVMTFDHGLRGDESRGDLNFVVELAEALGVESITGHAIVKPGKGLSLEMAAREARLDFFAECVIRQQLDRVATGHQADDVAELLLMRLARGAGAGGLAGLRPLSRVRRCGTELCLIRPLLDLSQQELNEWLRAAGHQWREDISNSDTSIMRNAIRQKLLPQLRDHFGIDFMPALLRSAELLRADDELLEDLTTRWLTERAIAASEPDAAKPVPLSAVELLQEPLALQRRILRRWLLLQGAVEAAGFESVARILKQCARGGEWRLTLPGEVQLLGTANLLRLARQERPVAERMLSTLALPGVTAWYGYQIEARLAAGIDRSRGQFGRWPASASLDVVRVAEHGLQVRQWLPGDRIAPFGMDGSRKVQDIFVDAAVPHRLRQRLPLIFCGSELAWIPGYRISRHFVVPNAQQPAWQLQVRVAAPPLSGP